MTPFERLAHLRRNFGALRLYALVDGAQYQQRFGKAIDPQPGMRALFAGTPDEALAHAGPWLVDAEPEDGGLATELAKMEADLPAVSWIIAPQDLEGLAQLLQLNMDVKLPDGRCALLRFWDPRVLVTLAQVMDEEQRMSFFAHIVEWHMLHNGKRVWMGRQHADAR